MKRLLLRLTAAAVTVCLLAGCGSRGGENPDTTGVEETDYDSRSQAVYTAALGQFYDLYTKAKEADSLGERYALMAAAEGKLLAAGAMLPIYAGGGSYAISRLAPYTTPNVLWGSDEDRFHNAVVTDKPITAAHRETMKAEYNRRKGTGTYEEWAEEFLDDAGYEIKDTYTIGYTSDPESWDVLASSKSVNARAIVNTYDGLYEYDCEGVLQPALAESYEKQETADGTVTYTFTLREGVTWVDAQGRLVAPVVADDFVAGLQHMMDAMGGLEYLTEGVIVGAKAYISGQLRDFNQVGIRAVDERTVAYTLEEDVPYFMTMLGYGVFAPMCRSFYTARGGGFGENYDPADPGYRYGKSPEDIAYCGPYLVANATAESTIVFQENPAYWNKDHINISTITWLYNDGTEELKTYTDTVNGTIDTGTLNSAAVAKAKADGIFNRDAFVSAGDATTYFMFFNLNRAAYANFNDASVAVSRKPAQERQRTRAAMENVHFRRALCLGVDRGAYNAQSVGEDLKYAALRNSYTPGNFVYLPEDVTVTVDGEARSYAAGTAYGKILQDQLAAEGLPVQVWDETAEGGQGSSDGFDGWFDPGAAAREMTQAVADLQAQGIPVTKEEPVYVDFPYYSSSPVNTNMANAFKKSVESVLNGLVIVEPVDCGDRTGANYAGYFITGGEQANYDIYGYAGWGPDYGDPQTYLDTVLPGYAGYMTKMLGIY